MAVPQWIELVVGMLLPPACREHVLGDLHERRDSAGQYAAEALSVLGPVVIGRIRRTTDVEVLLMEAFAIYLSYSAAALYLGQHAFLYELGGFIRLAVPTTVAVVGLLISNAYSDLEKQSPAKAVMQAGGGLSLGFLGQAILFDTIRRLAVPFSVMLFGSCTGMVLVSTLRLLFPPMEKRPKLRVERPATSSDLSAFNTQITHVAEKSAEPNKWLVYGALIVLVIVICLRALRK